MLRYFLIAIFLIVPSLAFDSRIVNSTDADEGEFPFAVSLRINGSHTCGATILNKNYILTAGHCVCNYSHPLNSALYDIQYGLTTISKDKINIIKLAKIYCHELYDMVPSIYDLAVLKLESPLPNNGNWKPVVISKEFDTSKPHKGIIIGWGRLSHHGPFPKRLQKLDVEVYDDNICQRFKTEHHICLGAAVGGACNGDSGTSLQVDGVQVGIASFITANCGIAPPELPNVYSRITTYYDWIVNIVGEVKSKTL